MKIKTKDSGKLKIEHNRKLLYAIIALIVIFIILVIMIVRNIPEENPSEEYYCESDEDCVPASCCHATGCINQDHGPDCKGMFCTLDCSGPLDCGRGACSCEDNICIVKNL